MKYAIHLDAGHDRNGNPRRTFVVFDENGTLERAIDEGYAGYGALNRVYEHGTVAILARVNTTATEIKNFHAAEREMKIQPKLL